MGKNLTLRDTFMDARHRRTEHPLPLGNPYKLRDADRDLRQILETARAVLAYEQRPVKGGADLWLGCCLAHERRSWTQRMLRKGVAEIFGYDAVPGLEVMGCPDLLERFMGIVLNDIFPTATEGLVLPRGVPMMERLVEVTERALALVDNTLAALKVTHD